MEIIHRQEELEHAEFERALLLSLAVEEERLATQLESMAIADASSQADAKSGTRLDESPSKAVACSKAEAKTAPKKLASLSPVSDFADFKPLKMRSNLAPLPGIKAAGLAGELSEKKREVEGVMRKASEQLAGQRRNEEELRAQIAGVDPVEAERRARHLKEQRDLLLAKKKAEREAKVALEEDKKRRQESSPDAKADTGKLSKGFVGTLDAKRGDGSKQAPTAEEMADMRRATMRMALARRMKIDLIESEEAKLAAIQDSQFEEYDRKLQQVEQMREDNRKREYVLSKQLEKQQEQIARNIKMSAAALGSGEH